MRFALVCFSFLLAGAMVGCSTAPKTEAKRDTLIHRSDMSLNNMKATDPTVDAFLRNSAGYAIFPHVGKGAVGLGGAFGHGVVYSGGQMIGYCDLTQASVGAQAGGQEYAELIVFQTPQALHEFESGNYAFNAAASAVVLKSGAAQTAKFENGVAVFTDVKGGLMVEASIGGQKFNYTPKNAVPNDMTAQTDQSE